MNYQRIEVFIITSMIVVFFSIATQLAAADKEPDYTSQKTWQDGMHSGGGNFMACHGPQGKGDGVMAESLDIKPRDISNKAIMSSRTDEYLFKVIKHGGVSVGLSENMPLWGTTFRDSEIKSIIKHIRTEICKCKYSGKK